MLTPEAKYINDQLIRTFGFLNSRPKFRIVWTGDQFEKRLGEYTDWDGDKKIRTITEVREVPKYPFVKPPWWMLERAVEFQDESIKNPNYYEGLYLFRHFTDKGDYGDMLPLRADMAIIAAECSLVKKEKRNYAMDKGEFEEKDAKKEKDIYEQICDQTSYLAHKFHHKEAIIMPGIGDNPSPNLVEK